MNKLFKGWLVGVAAALSLLGVWVSPAGAVEVLGQYVMCLDASGYETVLAEVDLLGPGIAVPTDPVNNELRVLSLQQSSTPIRPGPTDGTVSIIDNDLETWAYQGLASVCFDCQKDQFWYEIGEYPIGGPFSGEPISRAFNHVIVEFPNTAPVAEDDEYTTNEDNAVSGNVLDNDVDCAGNLTTCLLSGPTPSVGMLFFNSYGSFTYTPAADWCGIVTFEYQVCDDPAGDADTCGCESKCDTATVTVVVQMASQTIDNFLPANGSIFNTASTPGLSATASSGLQVSFAVASGPATIGGGTNLSFTGAGVVRIAASQGGDENWNPAANVTNSYTVNGLTYHVSATGGNDANSGLSWGLAKQTIQSALDLARSGDTVLVSNGIYGAISVAGGVTVRSVNGAAETIIGNLALGTRGAYLGTNASLAGFSITGAVVDVAGAGICAESGAQIRRCIIRNNTTSQTGGGVYGGNLVNCLLVGNSAANGGGAANASLDHCTVAGNLGSVSGGGTKDCVLLNSIVQRNVPGDWIGGSATYSCALPLPAGAGNLDGDPAFVDMPNGDFRLAYESPCLGVASAGGVIIDLAGTPRPQPKVYGGELAYEMGCYEYVPQARFVWTNGNAVAPYETWQNAANNIQTALDISSGGDQIVVEAGTYAPFTVSNAVVLMSLRGPTNTIVAGGGILRPITITAPATLEGFTVQNGSAEDCGGILADNGAVLKDIRVANNQATAPGGYGGGLCLYNGSIAEDVTVVSNRAQYGAGIYATATSEVHSSTIAWNTSGSGWGGGVYLEDAGTLADSLVEGNSSARGGGVYAVDSEIATTMIRGNLASEDGGGVAFFGGTLRNSWIEDNDSWNGAGIYASDALGHSCIVAGNIASSQGGGVYMNGTSTFYNLTIVTNQAATGAGGVWINGSGRLLNSIVLYNSPSNLAPGAGDIQYSCIAPPPAGTGNFEADPLFVATNDFHLRAGSPCVDAGTNEVWMAEKWDIDGQRRVFPMPPDDHPDPVRDVWIDIGADEAVVDAFSGPSPGNPFWGWNVVVDARLQMQATTNLVIPALWTNIGTVVTANQATLTIPHTNSDRMRGFRLIWVKP